MEINKIVITKNQPYTYEIMQADLKKLSGMYPFIKVSTIGHSVLNKKIYEIKIGSGSCHTHFNASFHGNEWITSTILMTCINQYLINVINDPTYTNFLLNHTVSFVPMVNPDGVNLAINGTTSALNYEADVLKINNNEEDFSAWKANIKGIDLNKQFPALWDIESNRNVQKVHFRDYPENKPISEPESIAMAHLIKSNKFERIHSLHTQGEEIYWGFLGKEPAEAERIATLYETVTSYKSVRYVDNYAGFKDWFINEYRKPGFTIEFGKGVNPLPLDEFGRAYEAMWQLFKANLNIKKDEL